MQPDVFRAGNGLLFYCAALTGGDCTNIHPIVGDQDCRRVDGFNQFVSDLFDPVDNLMAVSYRFQYWRRGYGVAQSWDWQAQLDSFLARMHLSADL